MPEMYGEKRKRMSPVIRRCLYLVALINFLIGAKFAVESLQPDIIIRKDFIAGYLTAKEILNGGNPYTPIPRLAEKWLSVESGIPLDHPTPHPILASVIHIPFSFVSYPIAATLWVILEIILLISSLLLICQYLNLGLRIGERLLILACLIGWAPVTDELIAGQLNTILLLLLFGAWTAMRKEKFLICGALLGITISLKLTGWPIVLYLLFRRRLKAAVTAGLVVLLSHLAVILTLGLGVLREYYQSAGPAVALIYRIHDANYSTWTWGKRCFGDFGYHFIAHPLISAPGLERFLTFSVPIAVLIGGLWMALKARELDTSFGILVIVGILISPVAWSHYLVLALIPIAILIRRIMMITAEKEQIAVLAGLLFITIIPAEMFIKLAQILAPERYSNGVMILPWWASILTLSYAIVLIGFLFLLLKTDRITVEDYESAGSREQLAESSTLAESIA